MIVKSRPEEKPKENPLGEHYTVLFYRGYARLIRTPQRTSVGVIDLPIELMEGVPRTGIEPIKRFVLERLSPMILYDAAERGLTVDEVMGGEDGWD